MGTQLKKSLASDIVVKATKFAEARHGEQKDDEGKSYFKAHLVNTARILAEVTDDPEIIAAGLLHDTIEDAKVMRRELEFEFGERVATIVWEVTKEKDPKTGASYFPNLKSKEAIMVKFADRLSNLSRMHAWPPERREAYLRKSYFWRERCT